MAAYKHKGGMGKHGMKLVMVALFVLFLGVGIYFYMSYNRSTLDKKKSDVANANTNAGGKSISGMTGTSDTYEDGTLDVLFFSVDWCPHCVKAKPEWEQFVKKYNNQVVKGYTITCVGADKGINCTNSDDPEVKQATSKYSIQHFPTLIFVQNGTQVEFDAKISMKNLEDFVNKLA